MLLIGDRYKYDICKLDFWGLNTKNLNTSFEARGSADTLVCNLPVCLCQ